VLEPDDARAVSSALSRLGDLAHARRGGRPSSHVEADRGTGPSADSAAAREGLSDAAAVVFDHYLAPMTAATLARGAPEELRARDALRESLPHLDWQSTPARAAASAYLHLGLREAQRLHVQSLSAAPSDAPALRAAAHAAYLSVLSGERLAERERRSIAARSTVVVGDLAASVARVVAAGTTDEIAVVAGRTIVPGRILESLGGRPAVDWRTDGIAAALLPALKGAIATAPVAPLPPFETLIPGGLWRFDFLLEEARRLAEQAAATEHQLLELAQLILAQSLEQIGAGADAVSSVGAALGQLARELEAIASSVPSLIAEVVHRARSLAAITAVLRIFETLPSQFWSGLGDLVADHFAHDIDIDFEPLKGKFSIDLNLGRLRRKVTDYFFDVMDVDDVATRVEQELQAVIATLEGAFGFTAQVAQLEALVVQVLTQAGLPATPPLPGFEEIYDALERFSFGDALDDVVDEIRGPDQEWLRAIVAAYFAAPLVAAIVGSGGLAVTLFVLQEIIGRIVNWVLGDGLLGVIRDLQRRVDRAMDDLDAVAQQVTQTLADLATLTAQLNLVANVLQAIEGLLPDDLKLAMLTLLEQVRSVQLANLRPLALTAERAFFRETAEFVDWIPQTYDVPLPATSAGIFGSTTGLLGSHAALADLGRLEAERIRRGLDKDSLTRRVISLKDLLGNGNLVIGRVRVNALRTAGTVEFEITTDTLDRWLPGIYRAILKDIEVLVRFELPAQFPAATELSDAELTRLIANVGSAGLLVDQLSLPTGLPATLTQPGQTRVRIPRDVTLEAQVAAGNPKLAGVAITDDPNPGAQTLGYRMLTWKDNEETQAFSHFDVQDDTVRFTLAPKQLKPFENRGLLGTWRIEIPALIPTPPTLNLQLPTIDDIFISVGFTADFDPNLGEAVAAQLPPAPPAPVGAVPAPTDIADLLDAIVDVQGTVEVIAGDVAEILGILAPAGATIHAFTTVVSALPNAAAILAGLEPLNLLISEATLGDPAPPLPLHQVIVHPVAASGPLPAGTSFPITHVALDGTVTSIDAPVGEDGRAVISPHPQLSPVGTWGLAIPAAVGALIDDTVFALIYGTG
jgi:hypothetical protein